MKPFASLASAAQLAAKQWVKTNPSNIRISLRTSVTSPHGTTLTAFADVKYGCLRVLDRLVSTLPLPNLSAAISHSFHIILIFLNPALNFQPGGSRSGKGGRTPTSPRSSTSSSGAHFIFFFFVTDEGAK